MFFMKKPIEKTLEDSFIQIANSYTFSKKMINVQNYFNFFFINFKVFLEKRFTN